MRQIELHMLKAIANVKKLKRSNTEVFIDHAKMEVRLHSNTIAVIDLIAKELKIYDGGYKSVTTKSRLNALLFKSNCRIVQKQYKWFIEQNGVKQDFYNGFTIDFRANLPI